MCFDEVHGINRAKSAEEIKAAGKFFVTPMQNFVFADDSGHIGVMIPGPVPLRSERNDSHGLVPSPGWDGRYHWQGFIPAADMIVVQDTAHGHGPTANTDRQPEG